MTALGGFAGSWLGGFRRSLLGARGCPPPLTLVQVANHGFATDDGFAIGSFFTFGEGSSIIVFSGFNLASQAWSIDNLDLLNAYYTTLAGDPGGLLAFGREPTLSTDDPSTWILHNPNGDATSLFGTEVINYVSGPALAATASGSAAGSMPPPPTTIVTGLATQSLAALYICYFYNHSSTVPTSPTWTHQGVTQGAGTGRVGIYSTLVPAGATPPDFTIQLTSAEQWQAMTYRYLGFM